MNFEIYLSFLIKLFKNENSFQGEIKNIVSSFLITSIVSDKRVHI